VARSVAAVWGTLPADAEHVDGVPIRRLSPSIATVRRPGHHVDDDGVDRRLPSTLTAERPTLVFPSIHRSERNIPSLTVHSLGNLGPHADVGGRPRLLCPTDPRRMVNALRLLDEGAESISTSATYEATHHGPAVELPAFFIEIGYADLPAPPSEAVSVLASVIPRISSEGRDRIALGVGGGHYAPHFTDLALHRSWAFGHLVSRHALGETDGPTVRKAYELTPGSEGIVYARAEDSRHPYLEGLGPRLRDQDAPVRVRDVRADPTAASRSVSGT